MVSTCCGEDSRERRSVVADGLQSSAALEEEVELGRVRCDDG
jgi:hypothetical protein